MPNPYLNRTAIRDDASFVGRTSELTRLFNRIGGTQPQSVSIVGDRRIGKSSLLRALMGRRAKFLMSADSYVFAYLDMQSRLRWTPEMFFERLAAEIAPSTGIDPESIASYDGFERWSRSLQSSGRALVLLIDEFQVLMKDEPGHQLPVEFFNYLRSLANSYSVSLVVTSHVDLYTLSPDHRLAGSPLFNILHKLHLGPFTEHETRELIELSAREDLSLLGDEEWIVSRGGCHPLYLQIACSAAFDWRIENGPQLSLAVAALDRRFMEEARPHFEGTWRLFTDAERQILSIASHGRSGPEPDPTVDALVQRGYLVRRRDQLAPFSECFRGFVLAQEVPAPAVTAAAAPRVEAERPAPKARIFLSYASEDFEEVLELHRRLEESGLDAWMDKKDLIAGDAWARSIDEAIQSADFFIMCLSTHSVAKPGVLKQELSRGLHQWYTRQRPDNFLIPVLLEESEVPEPLNTLQHVELWREDGWTRLRTDLEKAIARRKNLAAPVEKVSLFRSTVDGFGRRAEHVARWLKRRAFAMGLSLTFLGLLLLIGGLSGEALSRLIAMVGMQQARDWNVVLRTLEVLTLVAGTLFLSIAIVRNSRNWIGAAACAALWAGCALAVRIDVPAPAAFALAYDRYLVDRSDDWRRRLLSFRDPTTGGIRDGSDNQRVQAWTTAQAIVGLLENVGYDASEVPQDDIRAAYQYLENVRLPPPEDGWGYFEGRSSAITEITSWIALAEIASIRAKLWDPTQNAAMAKRITRDLSAVVARQTASGGWSPVSDKRDENSRTYSTIMALWALAAAFGEGIRNDEYLASANKGMDWMLKEHDSQLGWVPNPRRRYQTEDFPGLTAQALVVLELLEPHLPSFHGDARLRDAQGKFAKLSLTSASIRSNARVPDSDQHVHLGTSSTLLEGSTFLWYPWARAAFALLANDPDLTQDDRSRAARERAALTLRTEELSDYLDNGLPYLLAENLLGIRIAANGAVR